MTDRTNRDEASLDKLAAVLSELGLTPDGVGSRSRDNVIPYPSVPDAREGLELVEAFTRIRDAHKRSELLEAILKAAGR